MPIRSQRFTILTSVRVIFMTITIGILSWIWGDNRLFFTQVILGLMVIIEVVELIRFVNNSNREIARFLLSIRHGDFSATFRKSELQGSFRDLQDSMRGIIDTYKEVKIEKEAQYQLLQLIIQRISVGIIFLVNDECELINETAQRLLQTEGVKNWKLISNRNPRFATEVVQLGDNGRKLIEISDKQQSKILTVDVSTQLILDRPSKLITLQDINSEIEQKEIEAWHKLIRILTHEIMNSITPISSLTETMHTMLTTRNGEQKMIGELNEETISDILFSIKTIHSRSEGLLTFVENYRKLSRVPKPFKQLVGIDAFVAGIEKLMRDSLERHQINFSVAHDKGLTATFDPSLIQQVIINLITNSMHALTESPDKKIFFNAFGSGEKLTFEITDTGKGIAENELKEIFIPFFSTKKDGSGIGLSLSKQIISNHSGSITVSSVVGEGTTVRVVISMIK